MTMNQPNRYPAYEIEKLEGVRKHTVTKYVPSGQKTAKGGDVLKRITEEIEVDAGYMIYGPRDSSIRVSAEQLAKYGIDPNRRAPLIDEETGEMLAESEPLSIRSKVLSTVTKRGKA